MVGVRKFRSIEEMKRDRWRETGSGELRRVLASLWELGERARRRAMPRTPCSCVHSQVMDVEKIQGKNNQTPSHGVGN